MKIIEAIDIKKYFKSKRISMGGDKNIVKALDGINFSMEKGEIYSLVGETGSGKTTFCKILLGLMLPTSGIVKINGNDLNINDKKNLKMIRRKMQMIFQDPYESLDPRFKVKEIIEEPLKFNKIDYNKEKIIQLLSDVNLTPPEDFLDKYPHQLSGGQRQRVAIARALSISPEFLIADEPVSMLDASLRANFLNLLLDLNKKYNVSILMVTHDISIAAYTSKKISVLYFGKIVEEGLIKDVLNNPLHPYTQILIKSIPTLGKKDEKFEFKISDITNKNTNIEGCKFYPKCPFRMDICKIKVPDLKNIGNEHSVACHLY